MIAGADSNMRDYSGKKAYQYLKRGADCTFSISNDTFRSESSSSSSSTSKGGGSGSVGGGAFDRTSGLYSSLRNMKFQKLKIHTTSNNNNNNNNNKNYLTSSSSTNESVDSGVTGAGSSESFSSGSDPIDSSTDAHLPPRSKKRTSSFVHSGGASGNALRNNQGSSGSARRPRANSASAFGQNQTT